MLSLGIDPSGSERRRSGLAVMDDGLVADSWTAIRDEEILRAVLEVGPKVVSIDSPLALPKGRCCADSSCPCAIYGIVRAADRELARMGYHPYWTLLPSMVSLTLRGIGLKERLESEGLKVIEVYPGAAQDRLGLPRKKVGTDRLEQGLKEMGIGLKEPGRKRVHDELDAITAAYVGLCFLWGRYEAVGPLDDIQIILPPDPKPYHLAT